jgi:hypothetical protein
VHSLSQLRFNGADAVFLVMVVVYLAACRFGFSRWI